MADTIITNERGPERERDRGDSGAGWVVALIIIIALAIGGIILYKRGVFRANTSSDTTNVNVTVPNPLNNNSSGSSASGGSQSPSY